MAKLFATITYVYCIFPFYDLLQLKISYDKSLLVPSGVSKQYSYTVYIELLNP